MASIASIHAREVFDSRGRPTVEVDVICNGGACGRAIVPSGASTGRHEATELRDTETPRLGGLGVRRALDSVRQTIAPALIGWDPGDQSAIDRRLLELDATPNKSRLGANALLGVSLATARAAAAAANRPLVEHFGECWRATATSRSAASREFVLPLPMVNMISGGRHAGDQLRIQDFLILPVGADTFGEALDWVVETYWAVGRELTRRGFEGVLVGDEGGYGPRLPDHETALQLLVDVIASTGREPGRDVALGIDAAATQFFRDGRYALRVGTAAALTADELIDVFEQWCERFPIVSLEDPLHEDDWEGWSRATSRLGSRVQLVGDDLFVTHVDRILEGVRRGVANSVLIKLNQVGTLSETLAALRTAEEHRYRTVISARSGETEDSTMADLTVATGAGQIKIGSVARSERLAKYNQLLRLEELLGSRAGYAGGDALRPPRRGQ